MQINNVDINIDYNKTPKEKKITETNQNYSVIIIGVPTQSLQETEDKKFSKTLFNYV